MQRLCWIRTVKAKPQPIINADGTLTRRTRLLDWNSCLSYARMIAGNTARFRSVQSYRYDDNRGYVCYQVCNAALDIEAVEQLQLQRVRSAEREGPSMVFLGPELGLRAGLYMCCNFYCEPAEQHIYEVDSIHLECTCPDFHLRCRRLGICCKHLCAVSSWLLRAAS